MSCGYSKVLAANLEQEYHDLGKDRIYTVYFISFKVVSMTPLTSQNLCSLGYLNIYEN